MSRTGVGNFFFVLTHFKKWMNCSCFKTYLLTFHIISSSWAGRFKKAQWAAYGLPCLAYKAGLSVSTERPFEACGIVPLCRAFFADLWGPNEPARFANTLISLLLFRRQLHSSLLLQTTTTTAFGSRLPLLAPCPNIAHKQCTSDAKWRRGKEEKKSRLHSFFPVGGRRRSSLRRAVPCLTFSRRPHPRRYHIGQGLLIVRRQAAENGGGEREREREEKKGITVEERREGAARKEKKDRRGWGGGGGYYEAEG